MPKMPEMLNFHHNCTIAVLANFEPLSQQIDVSLRLPMGFWALTLSQTASRMRISYLIFLYFMIIHFQKCPNRHKCSISVTIAVSANFKPRWQNLKAPHGTFIGLPTFTMSLAAGLRGKSPLKNFYFRVYPLKNCQFAQICRKAENRWFLLYKFKWSAEVFLIKKRSK